MIVVSLVTAPPSAETIAKYFPRQMSAAVDSGAQPQPAFERVASGVR
jgi:hypothetical protein